MHLGGNCCWVPLIASLVVVYFSERETWQAFSHWKVSSWLICQRDTYECDFPGISNLNFIQFASSFCKGKLGIARRKTDVVVKTHPNYSSNPKGPSYDLFCKYQLLKYKPWLHSFDSAWDDQDNSDVVYVEKWHEFLAPSKAKMLVPNCSKVVTWFSITICPTRCW